MFCDLFAFSEINDINLLIDSVNRLSNCSLMIVRSCAPSAAAGQHFDGMRIKYGSKSQQLSVVVELCIQAVTRRTQARFLATLLRNRSPLFSRLFYFD